VILQASENSTTWFPQFHEDWLPPSAYPDIRFVRTATKAGLEIGGVVGVVPLENGDSLQIIPKVGHVNFIRMLMVCEGLYGEQKREFDALAAYAQAEERSVTWLVARSLAIALMEVSKKSLRFDHKPKTVRGAFAQGKIVPVDTARNLHLRVEDPIVFQMHERNYNTPENRVLSKAAQTALPLLDADGESRMRDALAKWSARALDFKAEDLREVDRWLAGHKLGGSRGYYVNALSLAKIILGQSGISSGNLNPLEAEGVLLNSAVLFENFLRKLLVDTHRGNGILITKGGGLSNQSLYTDGYFELEPDYVFQDHEKLLLVADAKYKVPDSKDHYQMVCYLARYGVKTGVLFMPTYTEEIPDPVRHVTPDGYAVWEVSLPLFDLDATESILAETLKRFASH